MDDELFRLAARLENADWSAKLVIDKARTIPTVAARVFESMVKQIKKGYGDEPESNSSRAR